MITWRPSSRRPGRALRLVAGLAAAAASLGTSTRPAAAIPAGFPIDELVVTRWPELPGLALPQVNALAIARDGFLWAGTRDGLARFDGRLFREASVPGAPVGHPTWVYALLVDPQGVAWATAIDRPGLLVHVGAWQAAPDTAPMGPARALTLDGRGRLWAGARAGVFVREGRTWRRAVGDAALGRPVLSLAAATDGVWIGTEAGVFRLTGDQLDRVSTAAWPDEEGRALLVDRAGTLWVGGSAGLSRLRDGHVERKGPAQGLPAARVYALHEDRDGTVWVGQRAGLFRANADGRFEGVGVPNQALGPVWTLAEDADGSLWAGTSGGLVRVRAPHFRRVDLGGAAVSRQAVTAFHLEDGGGLWVAVAGRGLGHRDGARWRWWSAEDGLCTPAVAALARTRDGALWIGGDVGGPSSLCRFDGQRFQPITAAEGFDPTNVVRTLLEDTEGRLWVGGTHLYLRRGDRFTREALVAADAKVEQIERVRQLPDGHLWLATRKGLWRRAPGAERFEAVRAVASRPYDWFYDLASDGRGGLFLAGESGFGRLTGAVITPFVRTHGFTNAEVFGIARAGDALWLATRNGPVQIREEAIEAFERGQADRIHHRRFGPADGVPADLVMGSGTAVLHVDPAGGLWFATAGGLARLDPGALPAAGAAPPAEIESVLLNGAPLPAGQPARGPRLKGALQIDFTAPALTDPTALRFRYRLWPFDSDWVAAGESRTARYTNLPAGRYRFEVTAALESTPFSAASAGLDLALEPALHETTPFRAALAAAALAAALALHRLRTWRVRAVERATLAERTRIARELHDTLAQSVNAIALRLEEARMHDEELTGGARRLVDDAWSSAVRTAAEARESIWQLRQNDLDREDLPAALGRLVDRAGRALPVRLSVTGTPRRLPPGATQALTRIAQEAMTNAIRYAEAKRVEVDLDFGPPLTLRVADDGAGMSVTAPPPPGHFGIIGMRERAEGIGATLAIDSAPGRGTTVTVTVPPEALA